MSVYDFSIFKNSAFSEEIVYTPDGGAAITIRAVVFRHGAKGINAKADFSIQHHPIVIEIDRTDVPTVNEMKDTVQCADINGTVKEFAVRKLIYSDSGCFKIGL
jgi:hypothetical protein